MRPIKIERIADIADTYVARDASGGIVWSVELQLDTSGTPFREEVVWGEMDPPGSLVDVELDAATGRVVAGPMATTST
jgi:hypothetical protein